jgi:hypothetical protein
MDSLYTCKKETNVPLIPVSNSIKLQGTQEQCSDILEKLLLFSIVGQGPAMQTKD